MVLLCQPYNPHWLTWEISLLFLQLCFFILGYKQHSFENNNLGIVWINWPGLSLPTLIRGNEIKRTAKGRKRQEWQQCLFRQKWNIVLFYELIALCVKRLVTNSLQNKNDLQFTNSSVSSSTSSWSSLPRGLNHSAQDKLLIPLSLHLLPINNTSISSLKFTFNHGSILCLHDHLVSFS